MSDDASQDRISAILVFTAAVFFAVAPFATPGFDGFDPAAFPVPQDDPPAQPAGYAFAIWGPIYLALLVMAAVGLFAHADDPVWDPPRWPLFVSLAIGASWLAVAAMAPVLATVLIWVMLASALLALSRVPHPAPRLLIGPIALYAGWLTAASCVSLALVGAGYGVLADGLTWAWIALAIALAIAVSVILRRPDAPEYAAGVIWALVGIVIANAAPHPALAIAAALGAILLGVLAIRGFRQAAT